jgi:hypothetical protein
VADVLIHRCTLRVVRRGGWNWGSSPKRLVEDVIRIFPLLLAKKLAELMPDDGDHEISAPLRIRVPVRLSDLEAEARKQSSAVSSPSTANAASLFDKKLDSALRSALGIEITPPPAPPRPQRFATAPPDSEVAFTRPSREYRGALQRLLLAWQKQTVLESRLAMFSSSVLETWHRALWGTSGLPPESPAANVPELAAEIATLLRAGIPSPPAEDRAGRLRQRILVAAEIAAHRRIPMDNASFAEALNQLLPVDDLGTLGEAARPQIDNELAAEPQLTPVIIPMPRQPRALPAQTEIPAPPPSRRLSSDWEVHVACALPFLLLAPLARIGYLETLAAVLEMAKLSRHAHLFAATLAYKILDPPERGWRRSVASQTAAAALAGVPDPIADEFLVDFARQIGPHTGPLDALLADTLIRGHTLGKPLVLTRVADERNTSYLLTDAEGCFPIAWITGIEPLTAIVRRLEPSLLLVSHEAAGPELLGELHAAGVRFIVDVPPTRNESWSRIQQGTATLGWTNHSSPSSEPLLRAAREIESAKEDAAAFQDSFLTARPAIVRAASQQLDRALTLAAGVAVGTIAWELWRERARTTPQLTLERFGDLDARVRFSYSSVVVRLALGRRHRELSDAGLLAPLAEIPWLAGRRLEFTGG